MGVADNTYGINNFSIKYQINFLSGSGNVFLWAYLSCVSRTTLPYSESPCALMLPTFYTCCEMITFSFFHLFPSFCLDFWTSEYFWPNALAFTFIPGHLLSSFYLLTPSINSSSKRLLPKSHSVLSYNDGLAAVFRVELTVICGCTASIDLKYRLQTAIVWIFLANQTPTFLDYYELKCPRVKCSQNLEHTVISYCIVLFSWFWMQTHEIWICAVHCFWQQPHSDLQACGVKWALLLGKPSILLLMRLSHS